MLNVVIAKMKHYHQSSVPGQNILRETHLERIISLIPLDYYWTWTILGLMFLVASILISLFFERSLIHLPAFLILSLLFALEGIAITWAHKRIFIFRDIILEIIDSDHFMIAQKYQSQINMIFNNKRMFLFGMFLIAIAHLSGIDYHEFSFHSAITNSFISLFYYITVYILGAGLYVMIMTAWGVHKIGHYPFHVSALFSPAIQSLGILYSKFTLLASTVYIVWGLFHAIVPPRFSSQQLAIWFGFFAVMLLAYFVLPQYSIHKIMERTKNEKAKVFTPMLREAALEAFQNPVDENISKLKIMLDIQHQLDKRSNWPFSFYEILHIILLIIIPLVVVSLEVLYGVEK